MSKLCSKQGCDCFGTKSCGACRVASYCSVDCQKGDWKVHKLCCVDINKLPTTYLTGPQIDKIMAKINGQIDISNGIEQTISTIKKLLSFLDHQYGVQVEGTQYSRRGNGDRIDSSLLLSYRLLIARLHDGDGKLFYAMEARNMAEHRDKSLESTLQILSESEKLICSAHTQNEQYELAEQHIEQSLIFARLMKGEDRIPTESQAVDAFATLRCKQERVPEANSLWEQSYILVSEAYGPVHPDVQEAALVLISSLVQSGNLSLAEDYCRMNYENLIDPKLRSSEEQENYQVCLGRMQLAEIWLKKTDEDMASEAAVALAEEAEDMMRKSCVMAERLYELDPDVQIHHWQLFCRILIKRGKYNDEGRAVLEKLMALYLKHPTDEAYDHIVYILARSSTYHQDTGDAMPLGDARDREIKLADRYMHQFRQIRQTLEA